MDNDNLRDNIIIGIGSNLGNRLENMIEAKFEMKRRGIEVDRESRIYESAPVGYDNQNDFLNQIVTVQTEFSMIDLLNELLDIETEKFHRKREIKNGPRTMDLDLLIYRKAIFRWPPKIIVPHERMRERRFVLEPLVELFPNAKDFDLNKHLYETRDQEVRIYEQ